MLKPVRATQFKKDVKRLAKSGSKDIAKLKEVITKLVNEKKLEEKYKNHSGLSIFSFRGLSGYSF